VSDIVQTQLADGAPPTARVLEVWSLDEDRILTIRIEEQACASVLRVKKNKKKELTENTSKLFASGARKVACNAIFSSLCQCAEILLAPPHPPRREIF
jgi:hypothetical protein